MSVADSEPDRRCNHLHGNHIAASAVGAEAIVVSERFGRATNREIPSVQT